MRNVWICCITALLLFTTLLLSQFFNFGPTPALSKSPQLSFVQDDALSFVTPRVTRATVHGGQRGASSPPIADCSSSIGVPLPQHVESVVLADTRSVTVHTSLTHPSCHAEQWLRASGTAKEKGINDKYYRPGWNCFKHGGVYNPGHARNRGRYLTLRNVTYVGGRFYLPGLASLANERDALDSLGVLRKRANPNEYVLKYSGHFTMVSGEWPQNVIDEIKVVATEPPAPLRTLPFRHFDVGYFQPPTDYLAMYHVIVEIVLTAFHRLADRALCAECARGDAGTLVLTSRPIKSKWGFKPMSCNRSLHRCLTIPQWGRMLAAVVGGDHNVYGLRAADAQFASTLSAWRAPTDEGRLLDGFHMDELRVGNPTHCEPLWGPDAFFAEMAPHDTTAYWECQRVLYAFRSFILRESALRKLPQRHEALCSHKKLVDDTPVGLLDPLTQKRHVRVLFTSRKGDWARYIVNEDEVFGAIEQHVRLLYANRDDFAAEVIRVRFNGTFEDQAELVHNSTTIFIGNHGANLIPSMYLRPNAAVITLSFSNPGFYPFSVFPSWLWWRDITIEQECNRRLWKGKCRWSEGNNNDMLVSPEQLKTILVTIDSFIKMQFETPKVLPNKLFNA